MGVYWGGGVVHRNQTAISIKSLSTLAQECYTQIPKADKQTRLYGGCKIIFSVKHDAFNNFLNKSVIFSFSKHHTESNNIGEQPLAFPGLCVDEQGG